jgi:F0F1-type ATP synthase delta subunit
MKKQYINAICELLLSGVAPLIVLQNLKQILITKGHQRIHKEILEGVLVSLERKIQSNKSLVSVASQNDVETLKSVIKTSLEQVGGSFDDARITFDQTLIGGYVVVANGNAIDASHKQKLVSLYRNITK